MTRDTLDDQPVRETAEGFEGMDCASDPTLLPAGLLSDGLNMMCQGDGKVRSRPGTARIGAPIDAIPLLNYLGNPVVRGLGYYDTPDHERILVAIESSIISFSSAGNNVSPTFVGYYAPAGTGTEEHVAMVQLIDRMFYLNNGSLHNLIFAGGVWTLGTVATFSSGASMPMWSKIVAHGHRLFAMESNGFKLYASAIGQANAPADWVITDNFRVGSGEGDPGRALISNQGGFLTMLCARSAWQIDTSNASVANWSSKRVTNLTGCVEGKTAVQIGQDILFLAREGVVSLGALANADSINAETALSAPIKPWIDRINWGVINKAFAVKWADFYLIALPLDYDSRPKHIFAYNLRTRRWQTPWVYAFGNHTAPNGNSNAFAGFTCAVVSNFSDKAETCLADNVGRLFRLDQTMFADYDLGAGGSVNFINSMVTRHQVHGAPDALKQPLQAEVEFKDTTLSTLDLILLRDGATPTTINSTYAAGADSLTVGFFTAVTGIWRKRASARNKARYRQAALQLFTGTAGMVVTRAALDAFVDAPEISNV
jgi:hypothetical protein